MSNWSHWPPLTGDRSRHVVRINFVSAWQDDDEDHYEAKEEACNGGRHDGGRGQEKAVVNAERPLGTEVHKHGEERCNEADDNALDNLKNM